LDRYHRPRPRLELGRRLHGLAHGVIDLSDGLVADLGHVARTSACLAVIDASRVPLSEAAQAAVALEPELLKLALTGGDDYELLFTAPVSAGKEVETLSKELDLPLSAIGKIHPGEEDGRGPVTVIDDDGKEWDIEDGGYRHF
jgi:thiamine-monophosphate kinase